MERASAGIELSARSEARIHDTRRAHLRRNEDRPSARRIYVTIAQRRRAACLQGRTTRPAREQASRPFGLGRGAAADADDAMRARLASARSCTPAIADRRTAPATGGAAPIGDALAVKPQASRSLRRRGRDRGTRTTSFRQICASPMQHLQLNFEGVASARRIPSV